MNINLYIVWIIKTNIAVIIFNREGNFESRVFKINDLGAIVVIRYQVLTYTRILTLDKNLEPVNCVGHECDCEKNWNHKSRERRYCFFAIEVKIDASLKKVSLVLDLFSDLNKIATAFSFFTHFCLWFSLTATHCKNM